MQKEPKQSDSIEETKKIVEIGSWEVKQSYRLCGVLVIWKQVQKTETFKIESRVGGESMDKLIELSNDIYEKIKNLEPKQAIAVLEIVEVFIHLDD